ncbi:MAG: hypothetical protein AAGD25_12850 [Cyanobacteria bacterium P01_F01_bin.150]
MIPLSKVPQPDNAFPEFRESSVCNTLVCNSLVEEILRGRKICRSIVSQQRQSHLQHPIEIQGIGSPNNSLDNASQAGILSFPALQHQIFYRLRQQILNIVEVEASVYLEQIESRQVSTDQENFGQWAKQVRDRAYRTVLDEDTLTQMAIAIQQYPTNSIERRRGASELVIAVQLADRFSQRLQRSPHYGEAVNRTLTHVYEKLDQYNPAKGPLMAWINYWLDIFGRRVQEEQEDPLIQSSMAKIIREKNKLRALIRSVYGEDILDWLAITVKLAINVKHTVKHTLESKDESLCATILKNLVICFLWGRYLERDRVKMEAYLFELAQQALGIPSKISKVDHQDMPLERLTAPNTSTFLSDQLRHYLATDPDGLLQKHIQGQPEATFQAIALAYLDGTPWKTLSTQWNVPIPSLSSFFQRQLKTLAPKVKAYLQH